MARDYQINGECLARVKGPVGSLIATTQELGLSNEQPIQVSVQTEREDLFVNAWGRQPSDTQNMGATAEIRFTLAHYDEIVLQELIRLSMCGSSVVGQTGRAGQRMGGGGSLYAVGTFFWTLGLTSPVQGLPWRFFACHLNQPVFSVNLGVERKGVEISVRAIPYTVDPYGGGVGSRDALLYDHVSI